MSSRGGFSIASVILSYFLVAGGIAIGLILLTLLKTGGEGFFYAALGVGGFVGGFVAGRASRGTTITEPAIGGILVILTIVGVFVGTSVGEFLWFAAKAQISKTVAIAGVSAAVGAIGGAMVSEKMFGEHSQASAIWLLHVSLAMLGACVVAFLVLASAMLRGHSAEGVQAGTYFGAMGIGAFLAGISAGASAPKRILIVSLLGCVVGTMGFYLLLRGLPGVSKADEGKAAAGFAIIGVGCGIVAMIGAAIGWSAVGKKATYRA